MNRDNYKSFSEGKIGTLTVANRFVRSATADGMADDSGFVTDRQIEMFSQLGRGSIGLIVTGHMYVRSDGIGPAMTAVNRDECVPGLRRLADVVHSVGDSKIVVQINHAGRSASECWGKQEIVAPSAIPAKEGAPIPRVLESEEIEDLAKCYGDAAAYIRKAGFDGVQIHGAHGYLVSQFLSPLANLRTDDFGGPIEKRARFLELIVKEIRRSVGHNYPILIKLASYENQDGGLTTEEAVQVGKWLEDWGIDAIEISGGVHSDSVRRRIKPSKNEGFHLEQTKAFRDTLSLPIISVGGFRSFAFMEQVLENGQADFVSMCRPFIREPDLVDRFHSDFSTASKCISCNGCFRMMRDGHLGCWIEHKKKTGRY